MQRLKRETVYNDPILMYVDVCYSTFCCVGWFMEFPFAWCFSFEFLMVQVETCANDLAESTTLKLISQTSYGVLRGQ